LIEQKEVKTMKEQKRWMVMFAALLMATMFFSGVGRAGDLEPSAPPAPTMKTLDDMYSATSWSRTLTCRSTSNCPRFVVLEGDLSGTVLDRETGLVWQQSPDVHPWTWAEAVQLCHGTHGGWRLGFHLPTVEQLLTLVEKKYSDAILPEGHPFTVVADYYWTSTTFPGDVTRAIMVSFDEGDGYPVYNAKTATYRAWCVRGGQSFDGR
jgi:hypothetical protein